MAASAAKKKIIYACERDLKRARLRRGEYQAGIISELVWRLKFFDEAASRLVMTRLYGRAAPGERFIERMAQNEGENLTMLALLSLFGVSAPMTIAGALDDIQ